MIALDLDGTTLARGHITPRTRRALEAAIEKGVHVVIATGRVYSALPDDVFQIRGLEYVITSNGAVITDLRRKDVVFENCISRDVIAQIVSLLRQNPHVPVEVFTRGKAYIGAEVYEELKSYGPACGYMSRAYTMRTRTPVDNVLEFMKEHNEHIENINIQFGDQSEKTRMRSLLEQIPGITLTSSMANNIEIGGATTSKASGLAALSELTGIELCEIMACGDSPNDMAMLSAVGFGVAVSNGEAEVLELADFVAPSNEDEGVAYAVERFVLGVNRPRWQLRILQIKNRALSGGRRMVRKLLKKSGRK
jgi:Cof subfamily protein (haloacid dehalogenase superfamily)